VLGHSEGGIIAPAVAAKDKSVAFVVMIAGPTIRSDKLFVPAVGHDGKDATARRMTISPRRKLFDQELYDAIIAAPSDAIALDSCQGHRCKGSGRQGD
jgi:hypothetical protein